MSAEPLRKDAIEAQEEQHPETTGATEAQDKQAPADPADAQDDKQQSTTEAGAPESPPAKQAPADPADAQDTAPIKAPQTGPSAENAEQLMLGILLLDSEPWDRLSRQLKPTAFYSTQHQLIYEAAQELHNKNISIDPIKVIEALKLKGKLEEVGGKEYITKLAANATAGEDINGYAEIVNDRALRRSFIQLSRKLSANAETARYENIQEVLQEAEEEIFALADANQESLSQISLVGGMVKSVLEEIDYYYKNPGHITGESTGFSLLDDKTSGLQKSDFVVLAGRPSMGKTSLALNIAASVAMSPEKAVLIFSMEMPTNMLVMRFISIMGSVNLGKVRAGKLNDKDWSGIRQAATMLGSSQIYIDDSLNLTPATIRSRIRRVKRMLPPGVELSLVVVDYIQLMRLVHTNENRVNELAEISRALKGTAKEFNLPVLALSQLNRGVENRENKRPVMADLRDSGAIEQDADVIFFIYRDEVYRKDNQDNKGIAEIIIGKQRNGPTGTVSLAFQAENASFANLDPNVYENIDYGGGDDVDDSSAAYG